MIRLRVAVLALTSVVLMLLGGSGSPMAEGLDASTSPARAGREIKDAPRRTLAEKPLAGQLRKTTASPGVGQAARFEPDSPVLRLLWLLTGASRRH